jgi:hypothetical protein
MNSTSSVRFAILMNILISYAKNWRNALDFSIRLSQYYREYYIVTSLLSQYLVTLALNGLVVVRIIRF